MTETLLVAVRHQNEPDFEDRIAETVRLIEAADFHPALTVIQAMEEENVPSYVKSGKLEELRTHIQAQSIDLVVTQDELSPSQHRNLEQALGVDVIDRTQLILAIFASRAKTREAKLQVQVATMRYLLPRTLINVTSYAGRQQGGGARNRGSGEQKLELMKRATEKQLYKAEAELAEMEDQRAVQRRQRQKNQLFTVALVGYTNAGKSTLLNALVTYAGEEDSKRVAMKDRLFETLQTASRRINLNGQPMIITDTVGFVSHLPHTLIKAFRSTLEEVNDADLLVHVVDGSSSLAGRQAEVTLETLREIGADQQPMITVYNKADIGWSAVPAHALAVSALVGSGIDVLAKALVTRMDELQPILTYAIPYEAMALVNALKKTYPLVSMINTDTGTLIKVRAHAVYEPARAYLTTQERTS